VKKLYGEKRPLNDSQRRVIDDNIHALVWLIDPDSGFVEQLFNSEHKAHIKCGVNKMVKVEQLLSIMRRRSVANFNKLVDALNTGGQPLLAQMLKRGGGKIVKEILPIL